MSFMYDVPGPKTRRRSMIATVVSGLILVAIVGYGIWTFAENGQLEPEKWRPFTQWSTWNFLLVGLLGTVEVAAIVAVLSSSFGLMLALGRLSSVKPIRLVCTAYIEVARTVPSLLLIYLMLFGLPQLGINFPILWKLVIPLTLGVSAKFAEIMRAGITSLPSGQSEAALSLGMPRSQSLRYVILPQAFRNVAPMLVVQFVSLLKDTTLGYILGFTELLSRGQVLTSYLKDLLPTYIVVVFIYLAISGSLTAFAHQLQKKRTRTGTIPSPLDPLNLASNAPSQAIGAK